MSEEILPSCSDSCGSIVHFDTASRAMYVTAQQVLEREGTIAKQFGTKIIRDKKESLS